MHDKAAHNHPMTVGPDGITIASVERIAGPEVSGDPNWPTTYLVKVDCAPSHEVKDREVPFAEYMRASQSISSEWIVDVAEIGPGLAGDGARVRGAVLYFNRRSIAVRLLHAEYRTNEIGYQPKSGVRGLALIVSALVVPIERVEPKPAPSPTDPDLPPWWVRSQSADRLRERVRREREAAAAKQK